MLLVCFHMLGCDGLAGDTTFMHSSCINLFKLARIVGAPSPYQICVRLVPLSYESCYSSYIGMRRTFTIWRSSSMIK